MDKDELIKSIVSDWDGDVDINNMVGIDFDDDVTIPRLEDNKLIPKAVRDTYRIKKQKEKIVCGLDFLNEDDKENISKNSS